MGKFMTRWLFLLWFAVLLIRTIVSCKKVLILVMTQVLLATSDAPVYFEGPVKVGDQFYVDGGVGGNCPLKQVM